MEFLELFFDLLKAFAWPIFFPLIIILIFKKQLLKIGSFFGKLIEDRGFKGEFPGGKVEFSGPDPANAEPSGAKELKESVFISSSSSPSESSILSSSSSPSESSGLQVFKHGESVLIGFGVTGKNEVEILGNLNIKWNPSVREVNGKKYEIGQRVYFAIKNISDSEFESPLCKVRFPSIFKHLSSEKPETGIMTINSNLWGIGGVSTELVDIDSNTTEISAFLGRRLLPGQLLRFFVRFNIPEDKNEFKLTIKFRAEGKGEIQRELILSTNKQT